MNMAPQTETKVQELGGSRSAGEMEMYYEGAGSYKNSFQLPPKLTYWLDLLTFSI